MYYVLDIMGSKLTSHCQIAIVGSDHETHLQTNETSMWTAP